MQGQQASHTSPIRTAREHKSYCRRLPIRLVLWRVAPRKMPCLRPFPPSSHLLSPPVAAVSVYGSRLTAHDSRRIVYPSSLSVSLEKPKKKNAQDHSTRLRRRSNISTWHSQDVSQTYSECPASSTHASTHTHERH